jgi:hypothetical protein
MELLAGGHSGLEADVKRLKAEGREGEELDVVVVGRRVERTASAGLA